MSQSQYVAVQQVTQKPNFPCQNTAMRETLPDVRKPERFARARVELLAANPDYKPIVVDLRRDPIEIEGIAVGVIRPTL